MRVPTGMERQRLFFVVVIGAILAVLAIMLVVVLVLGDNEDQGGVAEPDARSTAPAGLVGPVA